MRTITLLVGVLLSAIPAAAQSKVYTNADLSQGPVTRWTRTVTADELAGLAARQFQCPPPYDGPTVIVIGQSVDAFDVPSVRPGSAPRITGSDPYAPVMPYYDAFGYSGYAPGLYGRAVSGSRYRDHGRSRVPPPPSVHAEPAPVLPLSSGAASGGGAVRPR